MSLFTQFSDQIREGAIAAYPEEAVWLITKTGCKQVNNCADDPTRYFRVEPKDLAMATAEGLLAVVHSHPDGFAAPSEADMRGQIASAVPWAVLSTDGVVASELAWWGAGAPVSPLIGRHFRHGITDCYSLVRDYYSQELGIKLPEFPRNWKWWDDDKSMLVEGFASAGFRVIDAEDARPGDVWFAQLHAKYPNHSGILLDGGLMLHQPGSQHQVDPSKLSVREPIFRYRNVITHWLRHKDR